MQAVKVWNSAATEASYGTVGCLARWLDRPGLLSASHVLTPVWRGVSVGANHSIAVSLGGGHTSDGELANWDVPLTPAGQPVASSRDAAYASVDAATEAQLATAIGLPTGVRTAQQYGQEAFFFGATSARRKHTIIHDLKGGVVMRYPLRDGRSMYYPIEVPLSGLIQCDALEPTLDGDSGCLLFDSEGYALGLLVGTDPSRTYPYFTHLQPILDLFGLRIVTTADYPQAPQLRDLI